MVWYQPHHPTALTRKKLQNLLLGKRRPAQLFYILRKPLSLFPLVGSGVVTADRYFIYNGLKIMKDRSGGYDGPTIKKFYSDGEVRNGVKYYYTKDHLGSVREVLDAAGNIVARYEYDPYGTPTQVQGSMQFDFLYTGHFYHAQTQLHLAPYRAYNSVMGRLLSREPLGMDGPNLYHYKFNSPLNVTDPTGLEFGDYWDIAATQQYYAGVAATSTNPFAAAAASLADFGLGFSVQILRRMLAVSMEIQIVILWRKQR